MSGVDGRDGAAVLRRAAGGAHGADVALHGHRRRRAGQDHRGRQGLRRHIHRWVTDKLCVIFPLDQLVSIMTAAPELIVNTYYNSLLICTNYLSTNA